MIWDVWLRVRSRNETWIAMSLKPGGLNCISVLPFSSESSSIPIKNEQQTVFTPFLKPVSSHPDSMSLQFFSKDVVDIFQFHWATTSLSNPVTFYDGATGTRKSLGDLWFLITLVKILELSLQQPRPTPLLPLVLSSCCSSNSHLEINVLKNWIRGFPMSLDTSNEHKLIGTEGNVKKKKKWKYVIYSHKEFKS